jgi:hypothetical protein
MLHFMFFSYLMLCRFFSDFVVQSYIFQVSHEAYRFFFRFLPGFLGLIRVAFFDFGTRCIPKGCEGPILRYGMSATEIVGCFLVCMLPSALRNPF